MSHTPGPWIVDGKTIKDNTCRHRSTIARVDSKGKFLPEYEIGDAKLIAACPAMLEACKLVYENLKPLYSSSHLCMVKLHAAIAAAEGSE